MFKTKHIPWNKGTKGVMKAWNKGLKTGYAPWLGKKRSEETKRKISETQQGQKHPLTEVGKIARKELWHNPKYKKMMLEKFTFKGKTHSNKHRKKLSEIHKGSKNPQWKGGVWQEPYSPKFYRLREKIKARDNWTCQDCKIPQEEFIRPLHIHHLDENKHNNELDNLITLCVKCHIKRHKKELINK